LIINRGGLIDFEGVSQAEGFFDATLETTTSQTFVDSTFSPQTSPKDAGDYLIIHSVAAGNNQNNREAATVYEYRLNNTGPWIEIIEIENQLPSANTFEIRTGLSLISLGQGDFINFRLRFRRVGGGACNIKDKGLTLWRFSAA
jgi:hypothetical protein